MIKKITSTLLAVVILFTMAACEKNEKTSGNNKNEEEYKTYYFGESYDGDAYSEKDFEEFEDTLNPQEIYNSIKYDEKMLYGRYELYDNDGDVEKEFAKTAKFSDLTYCKDYTDGEAITERLSTMPYYIEMGPGLLELGRVDKSHEWAKLKFVDENGNPRVVLCTYTVSGKSVTFTPLSYYEVLEDENFYTTGYKYIVGDEGMTFEFSFSGPQLTLTKDGNTITLLPYDFTKSSTSLSFGGYLDLNSPSFNNIASITATYYDNSTTLFAMNDMEGNFISSGEGYALKLSENGLATFRFPVTDAEGNITSYTFKQFVYFYGYYSCVFTDGKNTYYYSDNSTSHSSAILGEGLTSDELSALGELTESELEAIVEKKDNLLDDLVAAFDKVGISVTVNKNTGELAMDTSVLFGGDSAVLTSDGKEFLNKFIDAYTSIVYSEKYDGFVSRTLVEGHTAPVAGSTYESGLPLSKERAENVKNYCISNESGVNAEHLATLSYTLEAVGYSNSKPVYDIDGNVDMEASRRVSFKFIINLDNI